MSTKLPEFTGRAHGIAVFLKHQLAENAAHYKHPESLEAQDAIDKQRALNALMELAADIERDNPLLTGINESVAERVYPSEHFKSRTHEIESIHGTCGAYDDTY